MNKHVSNYRLATYFYWLHSCHFSYTSTLGITTGGYCLHLTAAPGIMIKKKKPKPEKGEKKREKGI